MDELNPNHPATIATHKHWHKLCAFVMFKNDQTKMRISVADMEALAASEKNAITVRYSNDYVELQLITKAEAEFKAREAGGLPV
jgi:hypothetical protein